MLDSELQEPPAKVRRTVESPDFSDKVSRTIAVCLRCRKKKTKCDRKLPQCLRCVKAQVPCISIDPLTGAETPRSYLLYLEQRVQSLEDELARRDNGVGSRVNMLAAAVPGTAATSAAAGTASYSSPGGAGVDVHSKSESQAMGYSTLVKSDLASDKVVVPASELYIGSLPGVTFAKLMMTALKMKNLNLAVEPTRNMSTAAPPVVHSAMLPPKATAEQFLHIYFTQSNSQLPILHREVFLRKYFEPIYGRWESQLDLGALVPRSRGRPDIPRENTWFYNYKLYLMQMLNGHGHESELAQNISDSMEVPLQYHKPLFFLNIVFALASLANHLQYVSTISELFKTSAFKYLEHAELGDDPLENLEITLLMALYSLMRPAVPGVWYVLGKALRVCVDLGLHSESTDKADKTTAFVKERRRRLFWCTYSLDRQVCFYLGRPVGIPEASIKTPFPAELDDSLIREEETVISDYATVPGRGRTSITIALMIFCIRQIQLEVQRTLYENEELPRRFKDIGEWRHYIHSKLERWWSSTPKHSLDTACGFNVEYFTLNYNHTRLMIDGLSPTCYSLTKDAYIRVSEATRNVMGCYTQLYIKKAINYTWAAVYNLFMAGTSFLFAVYHCDEVRARHSEQDVKKITGHCVVILTLMKESCSAAQSCAEMYHTLSGAVLKLRYGSAPGPERSEPLEESTSTSTTLENRMKVGAIVHEYEQEELASAEWAARWPDQGFSPEDPLSLVNLYPGNLDVFFEELINMSPSEAHTPRENMAEASDVGTNTREGKKVLELIQQVPGEPIWDQFFSSNEGRSSFS